MREETNFLKLLTYFPTILCLYFKKVLITAFPSQAKLSIPFMSQEVSQDKIR